MKTEQPAEDITINVSGQAVVSSELLRYLADGHEAEHGKDTYLRVMAKELTRLRKLEFKNRNWIPINIPWRAPDSEERREVTRLSNDYAEWFDAETLRMFGPVPVIDWDTQHVTNVLDSWPELADTDWSDVAAYEAFRASHTDADVLLVAARRRIVALHNQFEASSPECAEWLRRIDEAVTRARSCQFCEHDMCRAGVALEIRSPTGELRRVIIGDCDNAGYDLARPVIGDDEVIVRCMDLRPLVDAFTNRASR